MINIIQNNLKIYIRFIWMIYMYYVSEEMVKIENYGGVRGFRNVNLTEFQANHWLRKYIHLIWDGLG